MDMDLEQKAIMRLREAADISERFYKAPLIVTTSGGKDSSVCVALAEKAGIEFEVMHNHTTVDAPETVYFVRREFKRLEEKGIKCTVNYPHYKGERVTTKRDELLSSGVALIQRVTGRLMRAIAPPSVALGGKRAHSDIKPPHLPMSQGHTRN